MNCFKKVIMVLLTIALLISPNIITANSSSSNSDFEQSYLNIQGSNAPEEEKIKIAIDSYFLEQLEARKTNQLPKWDYLFAQSKEGKALQNYETGKLHYRLLGERYFNSIISSYNYNPIYKSVLIDQNNARVMVINSARGMFPNEKVAESLSSAWHEIILIKGVNQWKILRDNYVDEMKQLYPVGTDWDSLIGDFDSYMRNWEEENKKLSIKPGRRLGFSTPNVLPGGEKFASSQFL